MSKKEHWIGWLKFALYRAIRTMAQSLIAGLGTAAILSDVDWKVQLSAAVLAGILSLLMSIVSLPELDELEELTKKTDAIEETVVEDKEE